MTPEKMHELLGRPVVPQITRVDPNTIRPFCAECAAPVNPHSVRDCLSFRTADGSMAYVLLCRPCLASLDAAGHVETLRRLQLIRAAVAA
jgi:hypothetical protein